jgi:prepilin-type N-terminal cleavage/methylation domain-containing protein
MIMKKRNQSAFTLVEVLISMGLLGIFAITLLSGMTFGIGLVKATRENLQATQLLVEKTECIRLLSWNQIVYSNTFPVRFTETNQGVVYYGTITLSNVPANSSTNIKALGISLTWTNGKTTAHKDMVTYVSRYGLWNYVSQ